MSEKRVFVIPTNLKFDRYTFELESIEINNERTHAVYSNIYQVMSSFKKFDITFRNKEEFEHLLKSSGGKIVREGQ